MSKHSNSNECQQAESKLSPARGSARTEYRSVLWGSFVWYGEKVMKHATLEEAIARIESMTPPVRQDVNNGNIDFYTIPHGEMVATVRCYIVPNEKLTDSRE